MIVPNSTAGISMKERRKEKRQRQLNNIDVTVISEAANHSEVRIPYQYSDDISVSGVKIRGDISIPLNTLLQINLTLRHLKKQVTAIGEVKWVKTVIRNKVYEAGIQFIKLPDILH